MSRKNRIRAAERARKKAAREDDLVKDTVTLLSCATETAGQMLAVCEGRLDDVDADLALADLAIEVWTAHADRGGDLARVCAELVAEQRRHSAVMESLARRFHDLAEAEHDHLPDGAVTAEMVRRVLETPSEERLRRIDRQKATD